MGHVYWLGETCALGNECVLNVRISSFFRGLLSASQLQTLFLTFSKGVEGYLGRAKGLSA